MKKPEKKETNEDGTGHNCDVKGCPMCWNDGYSQAVGDMDSYWKERIEGADIYSIIDNIPHGFLTKDVVDAIKELLLKE